MVAQSAGVRTDASSIEPVLTLNAAGRSRFVLVCDHAANRIPPAYGDLGLLPHQRLMHIAWDPGALAVALQLSDLLEAPLVHSTVSRLVVDCNRATGAADLVPGLSERTEIPGNQRLTVADRAERIVRFHAPFHAAIEVLIDERTAEGIETVLVTLHSFTPRYKDVSRPWQIGLIHGADTGFAEALRDALAADEPALNIGWNEPYSAGSGVTYTLEHHGNERGLDAVMIEIRHDEILEPDGVALWAGRLARCLRVARGSRRQVVPAPPKEAQSDQRRA